MTTIGMRRGRGGLPAIFSVAVAIALTGCSAGPGADKSSAFPAVPPAGAATSSTDDTPRPSAARLGSVILPQTSALTGLPVSAVVRARPVAAVAVSAFDPALIRGTAYADVGFEMLDGETGAERFLLLFQSETDQLAGPAAALRPQDQQLLQVLSAILGYQSGVPRLTKALASSSITGRSARDHPTLYRSEPWARLDTRRYVDVGDLVGASRSDATLTPGFFTFAAANQPLASTGAAPATKVTVHLSGSVSVTFSYDEQTRLWVRSELPSVTATNLIIQSVRTRDFNTHSTGRVVAAPVVRGRGRSVVLSGPQSVPGTWTKADDASITTALDPAGVPVRLRHGRTWTILTPTESMIEVTR